MKIFIPFNVKDIGGTATFAQKFAQAAQERDHEVTFDFSTDFDRMLIIADAPLWQVFYAKLTRKPIIQRLDGVYHPATPAGKLYWLYNLKMKIIYRWLADTVIYQSQFSQESCEVFLGRHARAKQTIIYNGVNIPTPMPKKLTSRKAVRMVTFSKFRRKDQIEPLLEAVKRLAIPYTLTIYGSFSDNLAPVLAEIEKNPHVTLLGKRSNSELLAEIGTYDIFLFSDQSACPNSVIEALAAGLPVVAFDRGSIKELIRSGKDGEVVSLDLSEPFTNPYPFCDKDYDRMAKKITKVAGSLAAYQERARQTAEERFNLSHMMDTYLNLVAA